MIRKSPSSQQFDLKRVPTLIQSCYDDDYDLNTYIELYAELNKMFVNFDRAFSFVTSELEDKMIALRKLLKSNNALSYQKIESMLNFEIHNEVVALHETRHTPVRYESGVRSLSRLHRAFDFVLEIFNRLQKSTDNDSIIVLMRGAYDETLAKLHNWALRKAVYVAIYSLPNRERVITDFAGPHLTKEEAFAIMREIVKHGRRLYNDVQRMFEDRDMLELP